MQPFTFERATDLDKAIATVSGQPDATFVAGGTELVNWLKEGIARPARIVDINALPLQGIELEGNTLRLGALARISDVAAHREVRLRFPALADALESSASGQLRNMASIGGNLMQRTRCPYFRAETELACNKRRPGSGCAARNGWTRSAAIFGWSDACVATHPSDLAVALAALEATVHVRGPAGTRYLPLDVFYRLPGDEPARETSLRHGELIVAVELPATPLAARSRYLKIRERSSYEFALVSAAAAVVLDGNRIGSARLALGGVAAMPWRNVDAERRLAGVALDGAALANALTELFAEALPLEHNAFKIDLARRTAVRALLMAGGAA